MLMFSPLNQLLSNRQFKALLSVAVLVLIIGMFFYNHVEHWTLLNSLYFSVITLTTVGYGDFTPHTDAGKIFTMVYILFGIGLILTLVNLIARNTTKHYTKMTESYIERTEKYFEGVVSKALRK